MPMWLLCDYGQVLSLPQPESDLIAMCRETGLDRATLFERYWAHRASYDRADITDAEYWRLVSGGPVSAERLERLVDLDTRGWLHPSRPALQEVESATRRGYRPALLSNAPVPLADALDGLHWLAAFRPKFFSCRLRRSKPDPAIYEHVVRQLGARPRDVVFLDDREANVAAAEALGMRAVLYREASQIADLPAVG